MQINTHTSAVDAQELFTGQGILLVKLGALWVRQFFISSLSGNWLKQGLNRVPVKEGTWSKVTSLQLRFNSTGRGFLFWRFAWIAYFSLIKVERVGSTVLGLEENRNYSDRIQGFHYLGQLALKKKRWIPLGTEEMHFCLWDSILRRDGETVTNYPPKSLVSGKSNDIFQMKVPEE